MADIGNIDQHIQNTHDAHCGENTFAELFAWLVDFAEDLLLVSTWRGLWVRNSYVVALIKSSIGEDDGQKAFRITV